MVPDIIHARGVCLRLHRLFVLAQFEVTPKAFANFSPRVGACDNPGTHEKKKFNAESVGQMAFANAFSVGSLCYVKPRVEATPG
jgi:hypothetical protein